MIIGLTAGIGSGKSTVLEMFKQQGAAVLIADDIVRQGYKQKAMKARMKKLFGKKIFNARNVLQRKKLAAIVFTNKKKLKQLEDIMHPFVFRELKKKVLKLKKRKLVVIEIPLLFESRKDFLSLIDSVCVVKATKQQQIQRLKKRGMTRKHALERMGSQGTLKEKLKKANIVIDNTGTKAETRKQVKQIVEMLEEIH
jgi:dephospho-CoA kinase